MMDGQMKRESVSYGSSSVSQENWNMSVVCSNRMATVTGISVVLSICLIEKI